jgi:hypothetical protein
MREGDAIPFEKENRIASRWEGEAVGDIIREDHARFTTFHPFPVDIEKQ